MTAVWAHRGGAGAFPENSLEAFADARHLGADGVELDVRRSAEGALVVHHDAALPGGRPIANVTAADLPEHVPLLGAALEACRGMTVNVEIKDDVEAPVARPGPRPGLVAAAETVAAVRAGGMEDQVILSSFSEEALAAAREAGGEVPLGLLLGLVADPWAALERAATLSFALHPFVGQVEPALASEARRRGVPLHVWTVNAEDDLRRLAGLGVDAVITDRVAAAVAAVAGRAEERRNGGDLPPS